MNPDDSGVDLVNEGNKSNVDTSNVFLILG